MIWRVPGSPRRRGLPPGLAGTLSAIAFGLCAVPACAQDARPSPTIAVETGIAEFPETSTRTASGSHLLGSASAKVKLVEYVSYTCPYCAMYEVEGAPGRIARYLSSGALSLEVRHVVHDSVDLATTLLARCGPTQSFFRRHNAYMRHQAATLSAITPEMSARWDALAIDKQSLAIAEELGLIAFAETVGTRAEEARRCLVDTAEIAQLRTMSQGAERAGIGTIPGFELNGALLENIHTWAAVRQRLDATLVPSGQANAGTNAGQAVSSR